ncbi:hypothetical protein Tco_0299066 [Tanacetum coccineum]
MENHVALDMIDDFKNIFQTQASQELYNTQRHLNACKMEEGQPVSSHVLKMKSYTDNLEHLGYPMPHVLAVNTIPELHAMLKTSKKNVPSKSVVLSLHMIRDGGVKKKSWKKGKGKTLEEELSLLPCLVEERQAYWLGMRSSKGLEKGVMVLHTGNRNQADVEVIGSYFLNVQKMLGLNLYSGNFVSKNNMVYFNVFPRNDIFEIDMDGVISIDKPVFHGHETVACILNMVPMNKVEKIPYEMWHGKVPKLSFLKLWGCDVLVKHSTPKKLETRSIKLQAPPKNQENNIALVAPILRRLSMPYYPRERYTGYLIYSKAHDLRDYEEHETYCKAMTGSKSDQ